MTIDGRSGQVTVDGRVRRFRTDASWARLLRAELTVTAAGFLAEGLLEEEESDGDPYSRDDGDKTLSIAEPYDPRLHLLRPGGRQDASRDADEPTYEELLLAHSTRLSARLLLEPGGRRVDHAVVPADPIGDCGQALQGAKRLVSLVGRGVEPPPSRSPGWVAAADRPALDEVLAAAGRAEELLVRRWPAVKTVASALSTRPGHRLTYEEVAELAEGME